MSENALELARVADAPRLAAMSRSLIETGLKPSWPAWRIERHIRHPESIVLCARVASGVAGFAIMQYGEDSAHLNLLAVAPDYQRRGIARELLGWLEASALTAGTFLVGLEVRAGNAGALAFYRALGYSETRRIARYYQGIEDAIRMQRDVRIGRGAIPAR